MDSVNRTIGQSATPTLMAPLVSPALCMDISNGQFIGKVNDVRSGFSIIRIRPENIGTRHELRHRNQVYMAVVTGAGTAQLPAVNMLVADDDLDLPNSSEEFRGYIEGYYVICVGVLGYHNRALADYNDNLVLRRSEMISMIEQMYPDMAQRRLAWAVIMMYIYRMMNDYLNQLLAAERPVHTGTVAVRAPLQPPDFGVVRREIAAGRLLMLTSLPASFYEVPPVQPLPQPVSSRRHSQAIQEEDQVIKPEAVLQAELVEVKGASRCAAHTRT